jgi:hypothetical protein
VTAGLLWGLVLWLGGCAIGAALLTGPSNLTVGLSLAATFATVLALVVDEPPRGNGRPW